MSFSGDLYPEAGATSVMSVKGDIVRYDSQRERYGIGSTNQVLTVSAGGLPAWATAGGGATVTHQTMNLTSDETTDSETMTDTSVVLTMPSNANSQEFFFGCQAGVKSSSGNSAYYCIEDDTTDQPQVKLSQSTSTMIVSLQYAGVCLAQEVRLRWFSDGGDSTLTLYGSGASNSIASCQSLEVG